MKVIEMFSIRAKLFVHQPCGTLELYEETRREAGYVLYCMFKFFFDNTAQQRLEQDASVIRVGSV